MLYRGILFPIHITTCCAYTNKLQINNILIIIKYNIQDSYLFPASGHTLPFSCWSRNMFFDFSENLPAQSIASPNSSSG